MIRFQVKNPNVTVREWNDRTTGQPRSMRIQQVLAFLTNSQGQVDDTPDKVEMILNNNQQPLEAGYYQLTPDCIYLDRNGRLQVSLSNIKPLAQPQKASA